MRKIILGSALLLITLGLAGFALSNQPKRSSPQPAAQGSYVALGDSVAAGVGLLHDSDSSACNRSNQAYPNLVAQELNYRLKNVACSGATLPAGILGQQTVNDLLVAPQLEQLLAQPKPKLMTLTIGANDTNWTGVLATCYTSDCGTALDNAGVQAALNSVTDNVHATLAALQNHYGAAPPRVLVTGYYQFFPTTTAANCPDVAGIDATELAGGRQLQAAIDNAVEAATRGYSFASFIPINFGGHELCTSDPWVQGLSDNQPFHPTAAGQAAYAQQIIRALKASK